MTHTTTSITFRSMGTRGWKNFQNHSGLPPDTPHGMIIVTNNNAPQKSPTEGLTSLVESRVGEL